MLKRWLLPLALLLALATALPVSGVTHGYTSASFQLTEDPMVQGSVGWIQGGTVGLDWKNVKTNGTIATGPANFVTMVYDDATAVLPGTWNSDQWAEGTAVCGNPQGGTTTYEENELRVNTTITAHSITGYDTNIRCDNTGSGYVQMGRYNGPVGDTSWAGAPAGMAGTSNSVDGVGIVTGDRVALTHIGSLLTVYINGKQINQVTDPIYTNGSPGMGHWYHGVLGSPTDHGWSNFRAFDGPVARFRSFHVGLQLLAPCFGMGRCG